MQTARIVLIAAAAALTLPASEFADTLKKSAAARPGGKLVMETEYGAVDVTTSADNAVKLELERRVDAGSKAEAEKIFNDLDLQVVENANEVRITSRFRDGWKPRSEVSNGKRRMCRDDKCLAYASQLRRHVFHITVPREYNVDLQTSGGSVNVSELRGSANARTAGGSIALGQIHGSVVAKTSGGSIRLEGGSGHAELRTSGGSIHVGNAGGEVVAHTSGGSVHIDKAGGKVTAHTSGGSIEVREVAGAVEATTSGGHVRAVITQQPQGPCKLETSGGSVTVELADNVKVNVNARAAAGRVNSDLPIAFSGTPGRGTVRGSINGGGPTLDLAASGGSINIKRPGGSKVKYI